MSIENTKMTRKWIGFLTGAHQGNNTDDAFCLAQDLNQKLFSQSVAQMHAVL